MLNTTPLRPACVPAQIPVQQSMTKGEASDLISADKCALATPVQLRELQVSKLVVLGCLLQAY